MKEVWVKKMHSLLIYDYYGRGWGKDYFPEQLKNYARISITIVICRLEAHT